MNLLRKRTSLVLASLFFVGATITGCSNSAPKCSDTETIDLVKQIANEKLVNALGQEAADQFELSVDAIRTTDSNEKTGAQQCAAQLVMKGPNGQSKVDFTYKSEKTDDGDKFYVTAYGL